MGTWLEGRLAVALTSGAAPALRILVLNESPSSNYDMKALAVMLETRFEMRACSSFLPLPAIVCCL